MRLVGKTAIVTGGAHGIGAAICRAFVNEGARVVVADTDDNGASKLVATLSELGSAMNVQTDVGERLDVHNMVAATLDAYGHIDILVNNAGIASSGGFLDITEDDFDTVMRVNLKGAFLCSQAVARMMVERVKEDGPPGTIINISSVFDTLALPDQVAYTVSKGGLKQLNNLMAQSLAHHGIRVNSIAPGSIASDMLERVMADADAREKVLARTPLGRIGEAAEIACVAVFLASDDASYITGQTIYADGGRMGQAYEQRKR